MAIKFANNAKTTLSASISTSDTTISVASGSVFPSLSTGDYFFMTLENTSLTREVVKVTARSGNNLTVTRAQDGTSASAFTSGDKAELRVTAASLDGIRTSFLTTVNSWTAANTFAPTGSSGGSGLVGIGEYITLSGFAPNIVFSDTSSSVNPWFVHYNQGSFTLGETVSSTPTERLLVTTSTFKYNGSNIMVSGLANDFGSSLQTMALLYVSTSIQLGHASDTTISRKSAGIAQIEAKQLATVGQNVMRASQYCVGDGSTDDRSAYATMQTAAAAADAGIIVDCYIRIASALTLSVPVSIEGGGFVPDTGIVLTVSTGFKANRDKVFFGNGTVAWGGYVTEICPEWWGVDAGGTAANNLASVNKLNAALAAGTRGGVVKWSANIFNFSGAWTSITLNGVVHEGAGETTAGTWFFFDNTTGDDITFSGCQHSGIRRISFTYFARKTSGYSVLITGGYKNFIDHCSSQYGYNGFHVLSSTETVVEHPEFLRLLGTRGLLFDGVDAARSYRLLCNNPTVNNSYLGYGSGLPQIKGNWATSTAYVLYDIVIANGKVWQCSTAGTSASSGTGPSSLPGTTASDAFLLTTADGTAAWTFIMQVDLTWIAQDSYAYSFTGKQMALINGDYGFRMMDTTRNVTSGHESYPIWAYLDNVDTDHTYTAGIYGQYGEGLYVDKGWQGSCLDGNGIRVASTFKGEGSYTDARVMGNAKDGVLIEANGFIVTTNQVGSNGWKTNNTYAGIKVAAGVTDFIISNNICGTLVSALGNYSKYGIEVATGASDHYVISGNVTRGNVTGGVSDGGSGSNKSVTGNVT